MDGGDRFGVSSIAFDVKEELVWAGNQGVSICNEFQLSSLENFGECESNFIICFVFLTI